MIKNILLSTICISLFTACTQDLVIPTPSSTSANTTNTTSPTPIISNTPSSIPSTTPSVSTTSIPSSIPTIQPSTIPVTFKYDLPAKFVLRAECDSNKQKTVYEVKNNIFSYNLNTEMYGLEDKNDIKTVNITTEQSNDLKKLIENADLSSLSKDDVKVPANSPMTMECRSILGVSMNVDGKEKLFELNNRDYTHSSKYLESFNKLKSSFDQFKDKLGASTKEFEIGKDFTLKVGESSILKSDNVSISVNKLLEDSRCPENAQCIWAGQVSFDLSFKKSDKTQNFTLTTGSLEIKKIDIYTIKLISVSRDNVLTLRVEK